MQDFLGSQNNGHTGKSLLRRQSRAMLKAVFVLKSELTKLIRFMFSIKLLLFLRCLAGFYIKITEHVNMARVLTAYNILSNTFMPLVLLWVNPSVYYFESYSGVFEHYVFLFTSINTQEEYFSECVSGMHRVDATMHSSSSTEDETLLTRFLNVLMHFRIATVFVLCCFQYNEQWVIILLIVSNMFVVFSKDVAGIPVTIILELFRYRVRKLRIFAEQFLQDPRLRRRENVRLKLSGIKKIIYIYKNLYDVIEREIDVIKFMITFKFVIQFRVTMIFVHEMLTNLIESRGEVHFPTDYVPNSLICTFLTVLPPLLFELSADEVNKIKMVLADQFLTCPEEELREALLDALAYLRVRRLLCVVGRVLDIDATTPLTFFSLVTNYVTVMIQFMKPKLDGS